MSFADITMMIIDHMNILFKWIFNWKFTRFLFAVASKLSEKTSDTQKITIIILSGFICRILVVQFFPALYPLQSISLRSDPASYDQLASNILEGLGYSTYWQPGFPIFLSMIYGIFDQSILAARVILSIIGTSIGIITYFITENLFNKKYLSYLAFIFVTFNPYLILQSPRIMSDTLALFMFALLILLVIIYIQRNKFITMPIIGLISGILLLIRPNYFFILIPIVIYLIFTRKNYMHLFTLLICTSLVLAPWVMYTNNVLSEPVLSTNGGINFYIGNNEHATGHFIKLNSEKWDSESDLDRSKLAFSKAISYISDNPLSAAKNFLKKSLLITFIPQNTPSELSQFSIPCSGLTSAIYCYGLNIFYILIEILGICAVINAWNRFHSKPEFRTIMVLLVFSYIIPIIFFVNMRMTMSIIFIYTIFISYYIYNQFSHHLNIT